jgi:hypothetical protein
MVVSGLPELGGTLQADLTLAAPNASAALILGISDTRFGGFALPLDLTGLGGTGCSLYTSAEFHLGYQANALGEGSTRVKIPAHSALVGARAYLQTLLVDPPANTLGVVTTQAAKVRIGS